MLRFGTAGLRGPIREGPDGMNVGTVVAATAGLVAWLTERRLGGGSVVVGYDARHGSAEFASAAAEVFAAAGFAVSLLDRPTPTPVLAYVTRARKAVAGVQITASHNPAGDNGYKVYLAGGAQLISPADRDIERHIARVGDPAAVSRAAVTPDPTTTQLLGGYRARVAALPRGHHRKLRIALTALHGVGGQLAVEALAEAGFTDVRVVTEQFAPDPDFPTVTFPNPEEPGACDRLLALAEDIDADLAIALDPDADRCAVAVRGHDGRRMLRGDETGVLLGDYLLADTPPGSLVASTVVSSRLLEKLAPARGARYAETLTGFKWLVRAGDGLVYAYEEAIGYCVDPDVVRDKDGISAAVLICDLTAGLAARHRTLLDVLDDYAVEFGVHSGDQVSVRLTDSGDIERIMARLRAAAPDQLAGEPVTMEDLLTRRGVDKRTDAVIITTPHTRVVIRPSGTEAKLKCYLETIEPVGRDRAGALSEAKSTAATRLSVLRDQVSALIVDRIDDLPHHRAPAQ